MHADVQAVPHQHNVTADEKQWKRFYTQEIGDIVYKLFEADFKAFGYAKETV